jgi:hypothetical protein
MVPSQLVTNVMRSKYSVFRNAINAVLEALEEAGKVIDRMDDNLAPPDGWSLPSSEEVRAIHTRALHALDVLNQSAKKWEAELLSRGWRV